MQCYIVTVALYRTFSVSYTSLHFSLSVNPVSYTHLDVYKRQHIHTHHDAKTVSRIMRTAMCVNNRNVVTSVDSGSL